MPTRVPSNASQWDDTPRKSRRINDTPAGEDVRCSQNEATDHGSPTTASHPTPQATPQTSVRSNPQPSSGPRREQTAQSVRSGSTGSRRIHADPGQLSGEAEVTANWAQTRIEPTEAVVVNDWILRDSWEGSLAEVAERFEKDWAATGKPPLKTSTTQRALQHRRKGLYVEDSNRVQPEIAAEIAAAKQRYNSFHAFHIPLSSTFVQYWQAASLCNSRQGDVYRKDVVKGVEGRLRKLAADRAEQIKLLEAELKELRRVAGSNEGCGMCAPHPECKALHIQVRTESHGRVQVLAAAGAGTVVASRCLAGVGSVQYASGQDYKE
jgi:hypothetical protein